MKKILIVLLAISILATPAYAVNAVDTILCKKVVLRAIERTVLVSRVTGEVKYILRKGQWILLTGEQKQTCQSMYNAQVYIKQHANK
jgi:hypothetical protein